MLEPRRIRAIRELAAAALGVWREVHPFAILAGGAVLGVAGSLIGGA